MNDMLAFALEKATALGFEVTAPLAVSSLEFRDEVRAMCRADRCRSYGKTWSCPPACGSPGEMRQKIAPFSRGVLVETVCKMEDEFDFESIEEASFLHKRRFMALVDALRGITPSLLPMGAGRCSLCEKCTYPTAPCRFPDRMAPSMEASGLLVADVCRACGIPYYHGKNTTTFISCVLLP